jgi:hypothetical protein
MQTHLPEVPVQAAACRPPHGGKDPHAEPLSPHEAGPRCPPPVVVSYCSQTLGRPGPGTRDATLKNSAALAPR